jgi:broad specificity phosphatase PhoE
MSRIYLVRHGQAGTREAYDSLSDVGRRQSKLLGEHFVGEKICFTAAYAGTLARQQQTAWEVGAAYREAGISFPEVVCDPGWSEFDLAHVYQGIAPQLCAEDLEFARQYEEMAAQSRYAAEDPEAIVNRRWFPCDVQVVQAWIEGRYAYDGESWPRFRERVAACRVRLESAGQEDNIVVFTSATPIGIWTALAMEVHDDRALRLAGALYNASCSVLRLHGGSLRLHQFNTIPHLADPSLRTHR